MLKLVTIVGARPQFIKAAAISRVIREKGAGTVKEILVHTGQHYDDNMSKVFFEQMEIPQPGYNLEVGSGNHGKQTGLMITKLEEVLLKEEPDMVLIYGDTNSTLAGAIAASKLQIPVSHVEAGLRSFNKNMPEEINRILADHVSTLLFTPTKTAYDNLVREGFNPEPATPYSASNPKIIPCGDVMYDNALYYGEMAETHNSVFDQLKVDKDNYVLCTVHREQNTDNADRLNSILSCLNRVSKEKNVDIVMPLHPRTQKMMHYLPDKKIVDEIHDNDRIILSGPLPYLELILLEKKARLIMTDSGGVQKEAFFYRKPCIVLRKETEWKELVDIGSTILADADENKIIAAFNYFKEYPPEEYPPIFGDGKAADFIFDTIISVNR
jgi:UDP-GlcNAc3NAcA epimerase